MANKLQCSAIAALSPAYAAWRQSDLGRITDALEQELILDLVGPPSGLKVLDVGCGDGILALELSRRGARVAGADASDRMIAAARARANQEGQDIPFQIAKAETLPFDTASFDVVVAITVLCVIEDAEAALQEMARVLKPGGRLIIGELGRYSSWAALRRVKGWFGSPVWRRARFRSAADLRRLATQAGLTNVEVHGAIFYPPAGIAARMLARVDRKIGRRTSTGAAFLALKATKP